MGDMGEMYNSWRKVTREQREMNRQHAPEILKDMGYRFEVRNLGAHLIVKAARGVVIDFWPGTTKWIARADRGGRAMRGRGLASMLDHFPPEPTDD